MRLPWICVTSLCGLLLAGCGKKAEPAPDTPPPSAPPLASGPVSVATPDAPPPPPPVDPAAPVADGLEAPPDNVGGPREIPLDADSLNTILKKYITATDRVPKSLEEMVKLKLIPRVPTPPAGMKFEVDAAKQRIVLVKK